MWSGSDAKRNGLVDVLGGLETAITIAKARAGIPSDQQVTLVEFPEARWFDFSIPPSRPFTDEEKSDGVIEHLKFLLKRNGQPLTILPLDLMEYWSYE